MITCNSVQQLLNGYSTPKLKLKLFTINFNLSFFVLFFCLYSETHMGYISSQIQWKFFVLFSVPGEKTLNTSSCNITSILVFSFRVVRIYETAENVQPHF